LLAARKNRQDKKSMANRNNAFYAAIPENVPRTQHPLLRKTSRFMFNLLGWRFEGALPDIRKAVVIVAPHTSNWDFLIACLAKFALDLKASYIMKREAFFWPFKHWLMEIGGIPIDRSRPTRIIAQVSKQYRVQDSIWLVITPEGTRKKVSQYKTGFVRIAHAAQVPIVVVGFDYKKKAVVFSKVVQPSGNHEQDANALYHYCRDTFTGLNPQYQ
jgi:1-acyl-sn-glycerol-3-phosphate acyltransferase